MLKTCTLFLVVICGILTASAQKHLARYNQIDVQHYRFELFLNDTTDSIEGIATIDLNFKKDDIEKFDLDLVSFDGWNDKGMTVSSITSNSKSLKFEQDDDILTIFPRKRVWKGDRYAFTIKYNGVPEDGLVIGTNKFGDRTFFGDNWPDRARYWLPSVDHPSDKATVEFLVNAPNHYDVIGTGVRIAQEELPNNYKKTHWKTEVLLPTKVMVVGVASFSIEEAGRVNEVPVTTWVYPQNEKDGFYDFKPAVEILDYLTKKIGEYPYLKLANVQSKTRFGGMENASNIFYFENSVNGKREREFLITHEIAHQWFGNSASESNWHHVWLSEGFATYMTHLYAEDTYGSETLRERLQIDRAKVIEFSKQNLAPIVDESIDNYMKLLNANSYQKGGWVLHMLRKEVGDDTFLKGIRTYYSRYKYSNALTSDFQRTMESVSGKSLKSFFQQWIFRPGHPVLSSNWEQNNTELLFKLVQKQSKPFQFPLEIRLTLEDNNTIMKTFEVSKSAEEFKIPIKSKVTNVEIDPNGWLLFESLND